MVDLFRGYDLTTVADNVAQSQWMKRREEALSRGFEPEKILPWGELEPLAKLNFKSSLLPIITDVLDALEAVKPPEPKKMFRYGYDESNRADNAWYENQAQHDTETATVWCLHLHVTDDEDVRDAILERMSLLPEPTGQFTFGDSWREWCEESQNGGDVRLGIYFLALPAKAYDVAQDLATHASFAARPPGFQDVTFDFNVSTAGDYAEQIHCLPLVKREQPDSDLN